MNIDLLNDMQKEAVINTEGPLLILAGAGSGKTRVLTHRIAYLIEEKEVFPSNILAITFTNKAAKEMRIRVEKLIGEASNGMWMGTFHSICVKILRRYASLIGYERDFVIYDPTDQKTLARECLKELNIDEKKTTFRYVLGKISEAKNDMLTPKEYEKLYSGDFYLDKVVKVYELYQRKLINNNAMDFDDLILNAIKVLKENEKILSDYQRKFKYVLVDEYQDTNKAQYVLVRYLSMGYVNLCVVGDNDQSIYGWRGADIRNIRDFEKDFPGAKIIKLEQNYRSSVNILNAANNVIKNNINRKSKKLWTDNDLGEKIHYYKAQSEMDEAYFVVRNLIADKKRNKRNNLDYAVLYRTNAQSRVLEDAFRREGVSYKLVGGTKFYDRREIKDFISYMRIIQNPVDELSIKRAINIPKRGIGPKTIEKIKGFAYENNLSLYQALVYAAKKDLFSKKINKGIKEFVTIIEKYKNDALERKVSFLMEDVLNDIGYIEELKLDNTLESRSRIENLREMISAAKEFERTSETGLLAEFLEEFSLRSDIDNVEEDDDSVLLMTLHSAKGLEFPIVFMVGLEEGIFPSSRSLNEDESVEEERRLMYVGITRAEEKLFITHSSIRSMYGKTSCNLVSRFIEEIPSELLDVPKDEVASRKTRKTSFTSQMKADLAYKEKSKSKIEDVTVIKTGTKVFHKIFGEGTVVSLKGNKGEENVTIVFKTKGIKKLKLSIAPLEIIQ
ncbi:DNA helicase PcrA [Helicovermis profundi]|uniref:ATP-dependent DNA helicase n=1 Tax=Helicovermis profundi TaxID=3065157 RepID=A0AAU9EJU8_9FIRM|nr:DNA helicase PcrA [Clostridia bacterium S502]